MNTKTDLTTKRPESFPGCATGREDAANSHRDELNNSRNFKHKPGMEEPVKVGLYLDLYHGREDLSSDMAGWGSEGPLIGPLTRLKVTYLNHLTLTFKDEQDALKYGLDMELPELITKEDCVEYKGVFYGDWSIEFYQGRIN